MFSIQFSRKGLKSRYEKADIAQTYRITQIFSLVRNSSYVFPSLNSLEKTRIQSSEKQILFEYYICRSAWQMHIKITITTHSCI